MASSTPDSPPGQRRRLGRKLLIVLFGLIALVVVILAILPYVISLEGIKGQIVEQAEKALRREVEIGQVRLQILSGLGAGLEQLTIHNPAGWQQPNFVKVGTLSAKVAFFPLLQRRVEISRIILSDGDIFIERDAKGRLNYDDLTTPKSQTAPPSPQKPDAAAINPLATLLVSKVSLKNVNVTFMDHMVIRGKTLTTVARDVQVDLNNIALNKPIDFDIAAALLTDAGRNVRLHGRLGPIPQTLAFDQVPIDATLRAENLMLDAITPYMGSKPPLSTGRLSTDIKVHGTPGGSTAINGTLSLAQAVLRDPSGKRQPVNLPTVTLTQDMTLDLSQATLNLTSLRLDLEPLQATLKGTVRNFKTTPQIDLDLATNEFPMAELIAKLPMLAFAMPEATEIQGRLQLKAATKGTQKQLRSTSELVLHDLSVKTADTKPITIPKVTLAQDSTVNLDQALLQLAEVRLDLLSLQATLVGTVSKFKAVPEFDLRLNTNDFPPAELMKQLPMIAGTLPPPHDIEGRVKLQGTVKGTSQNMRSDLQIAIDSLSLKSGTFSGAKEGGGMLLETAKTQASVQAHLASPRPPDVTLNLRSQRLVLDQQATDATRPKVMAPPKPASKATAPPVNLRGKVSIAAGRIKQFTFQDLVADLSLIEGLLKSTQNFTTYGGTFQGQVTTDLTKPEPDYTLDMKLADVKADRMTNELTSVHDVLFGNLTTDLKFTGQGLTWEAMSKSLTGSADVKITGLKLTTFDLMPKLALTLQGMSKFAGFPVPASLAEQSFDTLGGAVQIAKGKLYTENLKLLGKDLEVLAKGSLGLDQSLDFEGTTFLLGSLATSLGSRAAFLQDKQGRVQIPFAVRGTVTKPQIVPNEAYLMDLARKSLTKAVEEKGGKELQELLDKSPLGQPEKQKPAETDVGKKETPQETIEKSLKGLFKNK